MFHLKREIVPVTHDFDFRRTVCQQRNNLSFFRTSCCLKWRSLWRRCSLGCCPCSECETPLAGCERSLSPTKLADVYVSAKYHWLQPRKPWPHVRGWFKIFVDWACSCKSVRHIWLEPFVSDNKSRRIYWNSLVWHAQAVSYCSQWWVDKSVAQCPMCRATCSARQLAFRRGGQLAFAMNLFRVHSENFSEELLLGLYFMSHFHCCRDAKSYISTNSIGNSICASCGFISFYCWLRTAQICFSDTARDQRICLLWTSINFHSSSQKNNLKRLCETRFLETILHCWCCRKFITLWSFHALILSWRSWNSRWVFQQLPKQHHAYLEKVRTDLSRGSWSMRTSQLGSFAIGLNGHSRFLSFSALAI